MRSRSDIIQRYAEYGVANFLQGQLGVVIAFGNSYLDDCVESIGSFFILQADNFRCSSRHKRI